MTNFLCPHFLAPSITAITRFSLFEFFQIMSSSTGSWRPRERTVGHWKFCNVYFSLWAKRFPCLFFIIHHFPHHYPFTWHSVFRVILFYLGRLVSVFNFCCLFFTFVEAPVVMYLHLKSGKCRYISSNGIGSDGARVRFLSAAAGFFLCLWFSRFFLFIASCYF